MPEPTYIFDDNAKQREPSGMTDLQRLHILDAVFNRLERLKEEMCQEEERDRELSDSSDVKYSVSGLSPSMAVKSRLSTFLEEGFRLPPAMTVSRMPDLNAKNPSFAARIIIAVRDRFGGDAPSIYRAAGVSRTTYSAIISDETRKVSKRTALAFAFALQMPCAEAEELLRSAGYALSSAVLEDIIFKACLDEGVYRIADVNAILSDLGAAPFENAT